MGCQPTGSWLRLADRKDFFPGGEGLLAPGDAAAAILIVEDGRYVCQLRSQRSGIFYPDHWGLFGGAVESGEDPVAGLRRELMEELSLTIAEPSYFTEFTFDFSFRGLGQVLRRYYTVGISDAEMKRTKLGEGRKIRALTGTELLRKRRVVPYDAFAIWLHFTQRGSHTPGP